MATLALKLNVPFTVRLNGFSSWQKQLIPAWPPVLWVTLWPKVGTHLTEKTSSSGTPGRTRRCRVLPSDRPRTAMLPSAHQVANWTTGLVTTLLPWPETRDLGWANRSWLVIRMQPTTVENVRLQSLTYELYSPYRNNGIEQRKLHHRTSCRLDTAAIELYRIKLCKQQEFRQNAAMILAVSVSYAIWAWRSRDSPITTRITNIVNW